MKIGFDFDGTLLDSRRRHTENLIRSAQQLGVLIQPQEAQAYFELKCDGLSGLSSLQKLGIPHAKEIQTLWIESIETPAMLKFDTLYPDTLNILRKLKNNHQLILVTGRSNETLAHEQLREIGLIALMDEVHVVSPGSQKSHVAPQLAAVIGDTEVDQKWAADANAHFFASHYGFRSQRYWQEHQTPSFRSLSLIAEQLLKTLA